MANTAQLDPSLQVGSDRTSSKSSTPKFVIAGDGGAAKYECFIDGISIGIFTADPWARVYVQTVIPIADGKHRLTFNELSPNPALPTVPFDFSVDTVPPSVPKITKVQVSAPNTTGKYAIFVWGTADPKTSVLARTYPTGIGGALVDLAGNYFINTGYTKSPGEYIITVTSNDQAGNTSNPSTPWPVTVGTPPPPPPPVPLPKAPSVSSSVASVKITWLSAIGDSITSWKLYKDGILVTTYGPTISSIIITEKGSYTVAGVNTTGEGPQSQSVVV